MNNNAAPALDLRGLPASEARAALIRQASALVNGKYNIYDPATLKVVERTDFLKSICGHIDKSETLEDQVQETTYDGHTALHLELNDLANTYIKYRNKGARLPKFSRWVTGMFASNKDYAKFLADEGQKAAKRKIIMSVDALDILRSADTPHFFSCFRKDDPQYDMYGYDKVPVKIVEECPGIGIVYVDDENGFMMGRQWMHHAKIKDTGEDICVLTPSTYGCLQGENVARLMAAKGIKTAIGGYYPDGRNKNIVKIEYVGCFKSSVHHDLNTWDKKEPYARLIV